MHACSLLSSSLMSQAAYLSSPLSGEGGGCQRGAIRRWGLLEGECFSGRQTAHLLMYLHVLVSGFIEDNIETRISSFNCEKMV